MSGEMERLEYRDRFVKTLIQDIEGYVEPLVPPNPQIISEGENTVILSVTLEEWTMLLSAVFTGADVCYTDKSDSVRWILLRSVEQPVSICDLIIDCINNNPATRAAIVDALKEDAEFNQWIEQNIYRITEPMITGKIIGGDCDKSVVAGRAIAIAQRLDTNNIDFLEMVEVGTNDEERIGDIIGAIPVLGETPVDDVFLIIQDFLEDFAENYAALSTEGRILEMAEDIYCIMRASPDCSITFAQLFEYYQAKALSGLNIASTISDVIGFLNDGDFDNDDQIWFGMFALQTGFILNSREFFGVDIGTIGGITRDAIPSSAWEDWTECDDPPPEGDCLDFTVSDYGFYPGNNVGVETSAFGEYDPGAGLAPNPAPPYNFYWWRPSSGGTDLVSAIEFDFDEAITKFRFSRGAGGIVLEYDGSPTTHIRWDETTDPGVWPLDLNDPYVFTYDVFQAPNATVRVVSFCKEPSA